MIGGLIISGNEAKRVMLRAIGPSLPVDTALADPQMQLFDASGVEIAFNNNWRDATNRQEISDSTIAPAHELESAILRELQPGAYTAVVRGTSEGTGVGLIEAYDMDSATNARLANISTRGFVQTGDDVMIGGFIVTGSAEQRVVVRAIGPSLDISGRLEDPTLALHDANGVLLQENDNWRSDQENEIVDTTVPPSHDAESAIVRTLSSGAYTAIVRGVQDGSGIALVEVYALE